MKFKKRFKVTIDMPVGVSISMMEDYIRTSIKTMKGSFDPSDPLFHLDRRSVQVRGIPGEEIQQENMEVTNGN